jgi:hypothetical protein
MYDPDDYEETLDEQFDRESDSHEREVNQYGYRDVPIKNEDGEIIDTGGWGI